MKLSGCILSAVVFCTAMSSIAASADELRARQTAACTSDAMRLCSDFLPDENRVKTCMIGKQASLSSGCRVFFNVSNQSGAVTEQRSVAEDN